MCKQQTNAATEMLPLPFDIRSNRRD